MIIFFRSVNESDQTYLKQMSTSRNFENIFPRRSPEIIIDRLERINSELFNEQLQQLNEARRAALQVVIRYIGIVDTYKRI